MSIKYNVSGTKSIGRSAEQRLSNDYVVYGYPYYENGVCTEFATDSDHMYFVKKDKNTIYVDIRDMNDIKAYIYDVPNDRFVTIKGAIFDQDVTLLQSDWNEDDEADVQYILNKPTTLSAFQNDVGYITNSTAEIGWTNLNQELQSIISGASELFFIQDNSSYQIVNEAISYSNYPILRHNGKFYFYSHKGSNNEYYFYSIDGDGRCIDTFNTWSDVQLLSNVAYSGSYADLNNKPNLNVYAVKGSIVWNDLSQELKNYLDSNSLQYVTTNNSFSVINGYVQSDKYPILKHDGKLYFYSYKDSNDGIYFYNTHGEGKYVDITGTWHDTQLLSTVARTGNYSDLTGKPTIKQADWSVTDSSDAAYIKHKPSFKTINFESIIGSGNISTIPKLVITSSGQIEIDGTTYQDHQLWLNYLVDETGKTHFEFTQQEMAKLGFTNQVISSIINESVLRIEQNWEVDQQPGSPYYKTFEVIDTQMLLNQQNEEDYTVWFSLRADNDRVWKFRGDYDAGEGVATWTMDYEKPGFDQHPIENSTNAVTSGGIYDAIKTISDKIDIIGKEIASKEIQVSGSQVIPILITDIPSNTQNEGRNGCVLINIKGFVIESGINKPIDTLYAISGNGTIVQSTAVVRGAFALKTSRFCRVTVDGENVIAMDLPDLPNTITYAYIKVYTIDDYDERYKNWTIVTNTQINSFNHGDLTNTVFLSIETDITGKAVKDGNGNVIVDHYVPYEYLIDTPVKVFVEDTNVIREID